jgi:hypothetical protein
MNPNVLNVYAPARPALGRPNMGQVGLGSYLAGGGVGGVTGLAAGVVYSLVATKKIRPQNLVLGVIAGAVAGLVCTAAGV